MTMKTEPFLGGKWGWDLGEGDWKDGADENFLKFSYMINGNVLGFVSSLPTTPTNGDAYFLTTDNTLNARIDDAWYKFSVPRGFEVTNKSTGARFEFNGTTFVATVNSADKIKLDSISAEATKNSPDSELRDRATHTGAQPINTVTGLQTALNAKANSASPVFTGTVTAPTPPTSDNTTKVATTNWVKSQGYLTAGVDGFVTSVAGRSGDVVITKADVLLNSVDNTSDANKPVSTAQQTALNLKADANNTTLTGNVTLPSSTSIGTVTPTHLSYLFGATSNLQAQINSLTGGTGGYAPVYNPTFTGTVSGITKAMVGLGNVDNTSDLGKPVSTATQQALNNKQNLLLGTGIVRSTGGTISYDNTQYSPIASPTFTGNVTLPSSTTIGSVTATQLSYLGNVTSDVQSQLSSKAPLSGPSFVNNINIASTTSSPSGITFYTSSNALAGVISATSVAGLFLTSPTGIGFNPTSSFNVSVNGASKLQVGSSVELINGTKITGDFSNSTVVSRSLFQSNVTNGQSLIGVVPNGTHTDSAFVAYNNSTPTNSSRVAIVATATELQLRGDKEGTGNYLPLVLHNGGSNRFSVLPNGNVLVNSTTDAGYKFDVNGTSRFTGDILVNATSGQSSINLSQAGTINGRIFAVGGAGADIGITSGRNVNMTPAYSFIVNIGGSDRLNVSSTFTACTGSFTADSVVSNSGFSTTTFASNVRNPIWRFGNAAGFGLSYFQGNAGILGDAIGIHFGIPTAVSSNFLFKQSGMLRCTGYQQTAQQLGNVGGGNVYVDLNQGNHIMATAVGNCNWIFVNGPEGGADSMEVKINLTNGGNFSHNFSYTVWPSGVFSLTANGTDVIRLHRIGGYPWFGRVDKDMR